MLIHFSNQLSAVSAQQDPFHRNGRKGRKGTPEFKKGFSYSLASVASFAVNRFA
jgi:hypothetical protein